jgi:hypothetical protein
VAADPRKTRKGTSLGGTLRKIIAVQAFRSRSIGPYTPALVINVINPGDGALLVDALVELEGRRKKMPQLRYEVRLFTDRELPEVGAAFRELADPERQVSDIAARLVAPGRSFLFPRLSWSRRPVQDFLDDPGRFVAHATLMLDPFALSLRVARRDGAERSSFVHGLIQEAPRRSVGRGTSYAWVRRPAPSPCEDLPQAPGRSGLLARLITAMASLQASVVAPGSDTTGSTAVAALDLKPADQSLIYSAHSVSTWVLTADPYLGLDYFDSRGSADRRGYLLDFTPEFIPAGGRQLLLTTRAGEEIERLMRPAVEELELGDEAGAAELLVEALRSLSGRLALRLLSSPTQVQGALGMALSRLVLEAYGVLERALIIPLDAHPELTRESATEPNLRGDLLVVNADPDRRTIDFLVVEAKCMRGEGLPESLRSEIVGQVSSSEVALREAFDPDHSVPDRIDRVVQSWRLTTVLDFYLDRASRYGLVERDWADALRLFFQDLESGYTLSVRKMGLVFRLDAEISPRQPDTSNPEVPIWVLGRDVFLDATRTALNSYGVSVTPEKHQEVSTRSETLHNHPTWDTIRAGFMRYGRPDGTRLVAEADTGSIVLRQPSEEPAAEGHDGDDTPDLPGDAVVLPESEAAESEPDVFLGSTRATTQFGSLASPTSEPDRTIALDLDGCNTLSIFGVQGAGKSYTLRAVIESAVTSLSGLNRLPHPLASVVFHYHQTQDYPPEFVTMGEPNDDEDDVRRLQAWGGQPTGVPSLVVLTTRDMLLHREAEFPGIPVQPIAFASTELTAQDWRFLMGATGSDSFYLQLLNDVMRLCRWPDPVHRSISCESRWSGLGCRVVLGAAAVSRAVSPEGERREIPRAA